MSTENVARIKAGYEALARGEFTFLDEIVPDLEWQALQDPAPYHGREGALESIQNWLGAFEEVHHEPLEFLDAGDAVFVAVKTVGRARGGLRVDQTWFQVFTVREGKLARYREFETRAEALEAAGL